MEGGWICESVGGWNVWAGGRVNGGWVGGRVVDEWMNGLTGGDCAVAALFLLNCQKYVSTSVIIINENVDSFFFFKSAFN